MCETLPTVEEEMLFGAASLAFSAEISWCDIVRLVAFFVANGLISSNSWLMLVVMDSHPSTESKHVFFFWILEVHGW